MITYESARFAPAAPAAWRRQPIRPSNSLAQATATTVDPLEAPKKRVSVPALIGIGVGGGALLGFLVTLGAGAVSKKTPATGERKTAAAIGGAVGGLLGVGAALLFKAS